MIREKFRVVVDGTELRYQHEWTPQTRKIVRRFSRRARGKWSRRWLLPIVASGSIMAACAAGAAFKPVLHVYTSGSGATETIPTGATLLTMEAWGGGASGGGGATQVGGGGGAGGYTITSNFAVATLTGKTFTYTVGGGGAGVAGGFNGNDGGNTTINAGTITGWSNVTCNGGAHGVAADTGTPGAGGTVTNANAGSTNTTGNPGVIHGAGGTGHAGGITGDGGPYGSGSAGGSGGGGSSGNAGGGAAVFLYT